MTISTTRLTGASLAAIALTAVSVLGFATSAHAAITPGTTITTPLNQIEKPYGSAVSPDGKIMAIPSNDDNKVTFVYAETDTELVVTDTNSALLDPMYVAFSPDNTKLYVSNYGDDSVVVIDVATHTVVELVDVIHDENIGLGVSPDGTKLIVADDYDNVTIYDITNSYAQLATNTSFQGQYIERFFFIDNSTAYSTDFEGVVQKWNLSNAAELSSFATAGVSQSFGQCATSDLSLIFYIDNFVVPSLVVAVNPADGTVVGELDLENVAAGDGQCVVTPDNKKLLLTDRDELTPGHVFIIDIATLTLEETVTFVDVGNTVAIGIMTGCKVYASGDFQNIGQFQMPAENCIDALGDKGAALPDTGASPSVIGTSLAVSVGLLVAGVIALVVVRRRQHS